MKRTILLCAAFIGSLVILGIGHADDLLKTKELENIYENTTVEYDYGAFSAYMYTEADGTNYVDMNGNEDAFGEDMPIIKSKVVIAGRQVCFQQGWANCWVFKRTAMDDQFYGLGAQDRDLYATMKVIGSGDVRKIKERYLAEGGRQALASP